MISKLFNWRGILGLCLFGVGVYFLTFAIVEWVREIRVYFSSPFLFLMFTIMQFTVPFAFLLWGGTLIKRAWDVHDVPAESFSIKSILFRLWPWGAICLTYVSSFLSPKGAENGGLLAFALLVIYLVFAVPIAILSSVVRRESAYELNVLISAFALLYLLAVIFLRLTSI